MTGIGYKNGEEIIIRGQKHWRPVLCGVSHLVKLSSLKLGKVESDGKVESLKIGQEAL